MIHINKLKRKLKNKEKLIKKIIKKGKKKWEWNNNSKKKEDIEKCLSLINQHKVILKGFRSDVLMDLLCLEILMPMKRFN